MLRSTIIILLVSYSGFLFSQQITFSRIFETRKKNVTLAIINKHASCFHVLRYNKDVHDITIERRSKPSAEILTFTPLKLDSVNASWFDYENLDYLFFEDKGKVFFLFEKVLNHKREVYLKVVDTLGKSSGFIQLAVLEKDKTVEEIAFEFRVTAENKILIIGSQDYFDGITKRTLLFYDPNTQQKIWTKKLPDESDVTGLSYGYECNTNGDLFYFQFRAIIRSYKRKYMHHQQEQVPVFSYNLMTMVSILNDSSRINKRSLAIHDVSNLYNASIYPTTTSVGVLLHFSNPTETGEEKVFFLTQKWSKNLARNVYDNVTPLTGRIEKQLTFYDGTDYKMAADKDFVLIDKAFIKDGYYCLSERNDDGFLKEMLLVKTDFETGKILSQEIIPRKIFYYKDRGRFKNMGLATKMSCNDNLHLILIENPKNEAKDPSAYNYHKFSKVGAFGGNMVSYILKPNNSLQKSVLYRNEDYDYVALQYQSDQCDFVFYLNRNKSEKFAILDLSHF